MFGWLNNSPRYPATDQWGRDFDDPMFGIDSSSGAMYPGRGGPSYTPAAPKGGVGGMGPWMFASAGLNLLGGIMQGRAMQNAANTTAQAGMHQANIAAGAHRDVGKGNIGQSTAARNATFGWGADLDFQRQKAAKMWDKTVGRDLDRDANFRDSKQKIALLTDPDYRASKSREREHEIRKEVARNQAAMAGMFGPISGGFG